MMINNMLAASIAAITLAAALPAAAAEGTSDGFPPAQNLAYTHGPGADQNVDGTAALLGSGLTYLFIAGSAFNPRTSSQTVTYPGAGCLYSSAAITTSLELPTGALVQGVRLFYYSTASTAQVNLFLTTYPGDGNSEDLLTGTSTISTGFASDYFSFPSPLAIDNFSGAYVLTASMDPATRLCGMRVFYSE